VIRVYRRDGVTIIGVGDMYTRIRLGRHPRGRDFPVVPREIDPVVVDEWKAVRRVNSTVEDHNKFARSEDDVDTDTDGDPEILGGGLTLNQQIKGRLADPVTVYVEG
jgi:hypothetical protein